MTSIHDYVGGDFLKAEDLNGQTKVVQLAGFGLGQLKGDDGTETKVTATFVGIQKSMVIGAKCVAKTLIQMFASDQIEQWDATVKTTPTWVELYTEPTNFGDGLRLRPTSRPEQPETNAPQVAPELLAQIQALLAAGGNQSA